MEFTCFLHQREVMKSAYKEVNPVRQGWGLNPGLSIKELKLYLNDPCHKWRGFLTG